MSDMKTDILAVIESSKLPLTMDDIVQDVAVVGGGCVLKNE